MDDEHFSDTGSAVIAGRCPVGQSDAVENKPDYFGQAARILEAFSKSETAPRILDLLSTCATVIRYTAVDNSGSAMCNRARMSNEPETLWDTSAGSTFVVVSDENKATISRDYERLPGAPGHRHG